jgi:hypothetical protein
MKKMACNTPRPAATIWRPGVERLAESASVGGDRNGRAERPRSELWFSWGERRARGGPGPGVRPHEPASWRRLHCGRQRQRIEARRPMLLQYLGPKG